MLAVRKWAELMHSPAQRATFAQLADRYEAEVLPTLAKNTQYTQRSDIKKLRQFFCSPVPAPLDEIRPMHVAQLLQWKKDTPTTANRLKRVLSAMWGRARGWGYTDRENPCDGINGLPEGRRDYDVQDHIYQAIWQAACQPLRDAMDLAYLTGQRPGDTINMTEHDIADGMLAVRQHKTKARLRVRIEGQLAALLERIDKRKRQAKVWHAALIVDERGMAISLKTLQRRYAKARAAAAQAHPQYAEQIRAMWFYDLRAKAADDTAEQADEQAAAALLGHASVSTTKKHYLRRGKIVSPVSAPQKAREQ
ncbi:MAG: tyrosine-type recombinase/integrase [Hylemonella sp.]